MSLQKKIALVVSGIFALLLGGLYFLHIQEMTSAFSRVQADQLREQATVVDRIYRRDIEILERTVNDWSQWDDTYPYVNRPSEEYETNLVDETFETLNVHIAVFTDIRGNIVWGRQIYPRYPEKHDIPSEILPLVSGRSELLDMQSGKDSRSGAVVVNKTEGVLLVGKPIVKSDGTGSPRGTVFFGRYLDQAYMDTLGGLTGLRIEALPFASDRLPEDYRSAREALSFEDAPSVAVTVDGADHPVFAYSILESIFGSPAAIVRLSYEPNLLRELGMAMDAFGRHFVLFGGAFLLLSYLVFHFMFLRRLNSLVSQIHSVTDATSSIYLTGHDEFAQLAEVFNRALKRLRVSEAKTMEHRSDLEKFRLAVESSFDHMVITDPDGIILYANHAAEEQTGFLFAEMAGQTPALWGKQMPREFYVEFWDTIKKRKQRYAGTIVNKHKSGKQYKAEIRVAPILDPTGAVRYFVGIERPL